MRKLISNRHWRRKSTEYHHRGRRFKALNKVDVFFFMDKGEAKQDLVALRKETCERYIETGLIE